MGPVEATGNATSQESPSRKGLFSPSGWPACLAVVFLCILLKPFSLGYLTVSGLILVDVLVLTFHIISYQRFRNRNGRDSGLYLAHACLILFFLVQVDMDDFNYWSPIIVLPTHILDLDQGDVRAALEGFGLGLMAHVYLMAFFLAALIGSWFWMSRPKS